MKVYENIEKAKNFKLELKKVIDDLIPLRGDGNATEAYYDKHLENDWAYSRWLDDKRDWDLHVHSNRKFPDFKLPQGAIAHEKAKEFRKALLEVIKDDRDTFGYLYFLLTSEKNREDKDKRDVLPCIPDDEKIKYAIQFDTNEVRKEIDAIDNLNEKIDCLKKWKDYSDSTKYNGELKTIFNQKLYRITLGEIQKEVNEIHDINEKIIRLIQWKTNIDCIVEDEELKSRFDKWINEYINNIERKKEYIQELPKPVKESNEETMLLPEELNTERARKYFTKAIECKYMEKTENGYRWLYDNGSKVSLAYFCNNVFCPKNIEKLPETSLNKLFNITRLGSALYQIYNAKKPPKWERELKEFFAE
ncbi:MAG: hypothetical protein WC131_03355 [Bacilli bacterium]|jgi:hypothetical protein